MKRISLAVVVLGAAGCGVMVKSYRAVPCLPDGECAPFGYRLEPEIFLSASGLGLTVGASDDPLAMWFAPLLLPAFPFPIDRWDRPGNLVVDLHFTTSRRGITFSPDRVRLRVGGRDPIGPSSLRAPRMDAEPVAELPRREPVRDSNVDLLGSEFFLLEFPVASPLEGRIELDLAGIQIDGVDLQLPLLFLEPSYSVEMLPAL